MWTAIESLLALINPSKSAKENFSGLLSSDEWSFALECISKLQNHGIYTIKTVAICATGLNLIAKRLLAFEFGTEEEFVERRETNLYKLYVKENGKKQKQTASVTVLHMPTV